MSVFLEILRCILCCVEDRGDEYEYETLYGNNSGETITPNIYRVGFGSRSSNPTNFEPTYVETVKRIDDVHSASSIYAKYEPISSYSPHTSSSMLQQPSSTKLTYSSSPTLSRSEPPKSSSNQNQSLTSHLSSSKTLSFAPSTSSKPCTKEAKVSPSSKPIPKASLSSSESSPSSFKHPPSFKLTLTPAFSNVTNQQTKAANKQVEKNTSPILKFQTSHSEPSPLQLWLAPTSPNGTNEHSKANYIWVQKDALPIYAIPKDIQDLIKKDKVPGVLKRPLCVSTYKDYFAALLYAEDFYIEQWSKFKLLGITLKLQEATIKWSYFTDSDDKDDRIFVEFKIDAAREKRPFLLSRDFVFAKPSGSNIEPFQGIIYRVVKSTTVLVEFGKGFHSQHYSSRKYDVSFSFNRVCLKRGHQAIEAASHPTFESFTFPSFRSRRLISASSPSYFNYKLDTDQMSAVQQIIKFHGSPPYLIEGPLCVTKEKRNEPKALSRTGLVIQEAMLQIYKKSRDHRILVCAPINSTCDLLTRSLKKYIPESDIFRGNAAFREIDGVPLDILPSCVLKGECFACPPLQELQKFRVIVSTYVSSFRLHNKGIMAGHFSHIFVVDASSATEPEAMIALANFATDDTTVIVTGAQGNRSGWVRSDIARENGLRESYFERLHEKIASNSVNKSLFLAQIDNPKSNCKSDNDAYSLVSYSIL
ncbi:probable RNA helicase SDE3 [Jatropha curcas]|uniref:probable RNA helicase SDE3 n=1 Tax=Jatropha curcas TaxID=180498 RepID=UPI001893E2F9|nr:probable RNA helicase SDE3 [Jatropha curcas]